MNAFGTPRNAAAAAARIDLGRKADLCAKALAGARRLSQVGKFGAPLNQLVARAGELLDDMDEILVSLDPARNRPDFATAASLHRELEYLQAAITLQRREAAGKAEAVDRR